MPEFRNEVALGPVPIRLDGRGLVAAFGIVGDEAIEEFLDRWGLTARHPLGAGVSSAPDFGKPVLCDAACLLDGDLAIAADRGLPALAAVGDIRDHEGFSPGGRDLHEKAGYRRIAEFVVAFLRGCGVHRRLGEFDLGHS